MPTPCTSCRKVQSSTSPNFLLTCLQCARAWHHRCHAPPVPDKELIAIIKAYNEIKHKPNARFNWTCGSCKGKVKQSASPVPSSSKSQPRPPPETIIIDDDDDIALLDDRKPAPVVNTKHEPKGSSTRPPPSVASMRAPSLPSTSKLPTSPKAQKKPVFLGKKTARPAAGPVRIIDDPISFDLPEQRPVLKHASTSSGLVSGFVDLTVSDEDVALDHNRVQVELPRSTSPTLSGSTRPASVQRESSIARTGRISSIPRHPTVPGDPVSRSTVAEFSPEADADDRQVKAEQIIAVLPTPTPPPPKGSRSTAHRAGQHQFNPALLPFFVNARHSVAESDADASPRKPDIWQRKAALRQKDGQRRLTEGQVAPDLGMVPSGSIPRRKKAVPSFKGSIRPEQTTLHLDSQTPYFFSADVWMEKKRRQMALRA